jgi:hypothetical protein
MTATGILLLPSGRLSASTTRRPEEQDPPGAGHTHATAAPGEPFVQNDGSLKIKGASLESTGGLSSPCISAFQTPPRLPSSHPTKRLRTLMSVLSRLGLWHVSQRWILVLETASTCHSRRPLLDHGRPLRCLMACDWMNCTSTSRRVHGDSALPFTKPAPWGFSCYSFF